MWASGSPDQFSPAITLERPAVRLAFAPTVARMQGLFGGDIGTAETLRYMRQMVADSIRHPLQIIREKALVLVACLPERHWTSEISACHEFAKSIRYVNDPEDFQAAVTPEKTLEYGQGNCVQKCTLCAALLKSIGHPARFVALGIKGGPFSHVIVESLVGERWVPLECILKVPMGWYPPDATSRYVLKV